MGRTRLPFQSTLPVEGATAAAIEARLTELFQSTLPVEGATKLAGKRLSNPAVSIHAPRGGSDLVFLIILSIHLSFNPRSPWRERLKPPTHWYSTLQFQSTLPVEGATSIGAA